MGSWGVSPGQLGCLRVGSSFWDSSGFLVGGAADGTGVPRPRRRLKDCTELNPG